MSGRGQAIVVALLVGVASTTASAQGVCVECQEPDRNYRCTVKDAERVQHIRSSGRALEYLCISDLARAGGHKTCRVNTSYSGPCIGHHHEIDLAKAAPDGVVIGKPPEQEGAAVPPPATPAKKGPPQTLEELARDTMSKSKEQISEADQKVRKAGDAVGGAMKKTWDCLTSLFNRC